LRFAIGADSSDRRSFRQSLLVPSGHLVVVFGVREDRTVLRRREPVATEANLKSVAVMLMYMDAKLDEILREIRSGDDEEADDAE
jgi:hypothetical protein